MWQSLAAAVDFAHAVLMAAWVATIPLLFWHRWPRLTRACGVYAIAFIFVSRLSHQVLGECFLTAIARALWRLASPVDGSSEEWFTVRAARAVFHCAPSHHALSLACEGLILLTAAGALWSLHGWSRATASRAQPFTSFAHLVPRRSRSTS
jgi:hypothetical protein